jgi:hypothetical protein
MMSVHHATMGTCCSTIFTTNRGPWHKDLTHWNYERWEDNDHYKGQELSSARIQGYSCLIFKTLSLWLLCRWVVRFLMLGWLYELFLVYSLMMLYLLQFNLIIYLLSLCL